MVRFVFREHIIESHAYMLYLVPTPIGNLEDMSLRAIKTLQSSDVILAEDTRTSSPLLKHFGVQKTVYAHHKYNEHKAVAEIIRLLKDGKVISLISDAGTPSISDPGFLLVREALKEGIKVQCLPGATAFVPALVNSGLPSDRFVFEGFLPVKKGRKTRLIELSEEERTMIFYESPHRLGKTLEQFECYFGGDRPAAVSREISKLFEENVTGSISELREHFTGTLKGEFVVVVSGKNYHPN